MDASAQQWGNESAGPQSSPKVDLFHLSFTTGPFFPQNSQLRVNFDQSRFDSSAQAMAEPQVPTVEPQDAPVASLEPEADDWNDAESALGESLASSTTSMNSSILKYREENGRTYHAYKVHLPPKILTQD